MITIQNLPEQKLSDLFQSVLYDLKRAENNGVRINMSYYVSNELCTVCLGGAAVCGFMSDYTKDTLEQVRTGIFNGDGFRDLNIHSSEKVKVDGIEITEKERLKLIYMALMFDCFRRGSLHAMLMYYNYLSNGKVSSNKIIDIIEDYSEPDCFYSYPDMKKLKKSIQRFIKVLIKHKL
jgi:hypothetical protein